MKIKSAMIPIEFGVNHPELQSHKQSLIKRGWQEHNFEKVSSQKMFNPAPGIHSEVFEANGKPLKYRDEPKFVKTKIVPDVLPQHKSSYSVLVSPDGKSVAYGGLEMHKYDKPTPVLTISKLKDKGTVIDKGVEYENRFTEKGIRHISEPITIQEVHKILKNNRTTEVPEELVGQLVNSKNSVVYEIDDRHTQAQVLKMLFLGKTPSLSRTKEEHTTSERVWGEFASSKYDPTNKEKRFGDAKYKTPLDTAVLNNMRLDSEKAVSLLNKMGDVTFHIDTFGDLYTYAKDTEGEYWIKIEANKAGIEGDMRAATFNYSNLKADLNFLSRNKKIIQDWKKFTFSATRPDLIKTYVSRPKMLKETLQDLVEKYAADIDHTLGGSASIDSSSPSFVKFVNEIHSVLKEHIDIAELMKNKKDLILPDIYKSTLEAKRASKSNYEARVALNGVIEAYLKRISDSYIKKYPNALRTNIWDGKTKADISTKEIEDLEELNNVKKVIPGPVNFAKFRPSGVKQKIFSKKPPFIFDPKDPKNTGIVDFFNSGTSEKKLPDLSDDKARFKFKLGQRKSANFKRAYERDSKKLGYAPDDLNEAKIELAHKLEYAKDISHGSNEYLGKDMNKTKGFNSKYLMNKNYIKPVQSAKDMGLSFLDVYKGAVATNSELSKSDIETLFKSTKVRDVNYLEYLADMSKFYGEERNEHLSTLADTFQTEHTSYAPENVTDTIVHGNFDPMFDVSDETMHFAPGNYKKKGTYSEASVEFLHKNLRNSALYKSPNTVYTLLDLSDIPYQSRASYFGKLKILKSAPVFFDGTGGFSVGSYNTPKIKIDSGLLPSDIFFTTSGGKHKAYSIMVSNYPTKQPSTLFELGYQSALNYVKEVKKLNSTKVREIKTPASKPIDVILGYNKLDENKLGNITKNKVKLAKPFSVEAPKLRNMPNFRDIAEAKRFVNPKTKEPKKLSLFGRVKQKLLGK